MSLKTFIIRRIRVWSLIACSRVMVKLHEEEENFGVKLEERDLEPNCKIEWKYVGNSCAKF